MYAHHHGPVPEGNNVCHTCDNPPCVNPAHLFAGTQKENMDDMWAKGRQQTYEKSPKGSQHGSAKLTESEVLAMREMRAAGSTYAQLVSQFHVSKTTVGEIVTRKLWRHI